MARLSNTPQQQLTFDLERRKSYTFTCLMLNADRTPMDLTGCTLRFVMKDDEFDDDLYDSTNHLVNHTATIDNPLNGEATFAFQAAELDADPGTYSYSVVLWTFDGFSVTVLKGQLNLHPNTESQSITRMYSSNTTTAAAEIIMRGHDIISVVANTMNRASGPQDIIGTGRPDDASTLEATTSQAVANAPVGTLFISLDGNNQDIWAWRRRRSGWAIVEGVGGDGSGGGQVHWASVTGKPPFIGVGYTPEEARAAIGAVGADDIPTMGSLTWENLLNKPPTYPAALPLTGANVVTLAETLARNVGLSAAGMVVADTVFSRSSGLYWDLVTNANNTNARAQLSAGSDQNIVTSYEPLAIRRYANDEWEELNLPTFVGAGNRTLATTDDIGNGPGVMVLTQNQYNALNPPDPQIIYFIEEE